ncbi:ATP-dependent DNA helicase DinG [Alishewanella longhuensis]|uniref:ATP-dependent DNA helicase DinG n=1 Tax=Alishewanella longhuensis TaxID=1091037 RepID=A0ABQ3KWA3_9ALTE|nr:ATP-dependent DNA helicase DinG [Alishewanella longhuensis]GHG64504.1 ATP-dependent DNA helicase DinG [Alishewanella longhuensis]
MLSDILKQQIRTIHQQLKASLPGYQPRPAQNKLIAEIASIIAGNYHRHDRIGLIEAGTGTGKSLAYLLGTLPYALSQKKTLVIATATVALQEQLVLKDLPFFHQHSGLSFNFTLVKGRQRYACIERLQQQIQQPMLFATTEHAAEQQPLLQSLLTAWQERRWLGDRDTLPETISDELWYSLQADAHYCSKTQRRHLHCPFHLARAEMTDSQVLVVNHSLLVADLISGNAILPPPEDCIYVIDEAHHLASCARELLSASAQLTDNGRWLEKLRKNLQQLQSILPDTALRDILKLDDAVSDFYAALKPIERNLVDYIPRWFTEKAQLEYRFKHAALPKLWQQQAELVWQSAQKASNGCEKCLTELQTKLAEQSKPVKNWYSLLQDLAYARQRFEQQQALWQLLHQEQREPAWQARWLSKEAKVPEQLQLHASPLSSSLQLENLLFSKAYAAILCSATLTALNSFDYAKRELGLTEHSGLHCVQVESPFAYHEQAEIVLPKTHCEPTDPAFTDELVRLLPRYLQQNEGSLVLFASYWQMQQVAAALRKAGFSLLVQGEASRQALLQLHAQQVQHGQRSILFGTQSFSEGLDLPGKLLTNLIITKLPFAVPTSPLEEALTEAISARGGNAFLQLSIPTTAKKLVQSCGRLLRQEQDQGRIVILDRRLISKTYGKAMLDALPPFRRVVEY